MYLVNFLCTIVSLREATIFVAPWQSPERVPCERDAPITERTPKCVSAHCANIQPHNLAFSVAKYLLSTTLLLYYVQPKLVCVKLANKLQTVNQLHRGGEVLPIKGHHREPAAGKSTYH